MVCRGALLLRNFSVVITVIAAWTMQVFRHYIINMVAMRNRFMPTSGSVRVFAVMAIALVTWRAFIFIRIVDRHAVLIDVVAMRVMKMIIMKIIRMISMLNRGVSTSGSMLVCMIIMCFTTHLSNPPLK